MIDLVNNTAKKRLDFHYPFSKVTTATKKNFIGMLFFSIFASSNHS
jgi:hypothetical protein